jgi:hypothetical protein
MCHARPSHSAHADLRTHIHVHVLHKSQVTHALAHQNTCIHTCIHTYSHTCIHTCMQTCIHTCIHTATHAYMDTCTTTSHYEVTTSHTYIHIHTHTYRWNNGSKTLSYPKTTKRSSGNARITKTGCRLEQNLTTVLPCAMIQDTA